MHALACARSGELFFFGYNFNKPPYLTVGVLDSKGELLRQVPVDLPWPAMMHDMALSKSYIVLLHLPLTVDGEVSAAAAGPESEWARALSGATELGKVQLRL